MQGYNSDELDKMKADAIRRARQMRSRASIPFSAPIEEKAQTIPTPTENKTSNGFSAFSKMLSLETDQLILIALALLLKGRRENIPIIIALLYIAM